MKNKIKILSSAAVCAFAILSVFSQSAFASDAARRKIAVQCYTFKEFTFEEMLAQLKGLEIDALEATPAQKISAARPAKINPDMNASDRAHLKNMLKDAGLRFSSFGVVSAKSEEDVKKYCEFAKDFGMDAILTEDNAAMLSVWDKWCGFYGVKMFVHHHSATSSNQYFDPYVMAHFVSKYKNVMANPDNGHWARSSIDSVEGFRKLEGEIGSIHFKDKAAFGDISAPDVPYGTGVLDMKAILAELDRQKYVGYFVIEYEANFKDPLPAVRKCVEFLRNN